MARRCRVWAVLLVVGALLAACKSAPPPAPPPPPPKPLALKLTIRAAADLNPNGAGRPSPVLLQVFQLRDEAKFRAASFDDLARRADQVLAGVLVARTEQMVPPGATIRIPLEVQPETRLLGVIAEYNNLADSDWRALSANPPGGLITLLKDHSVIVVLQRQGVSVSAAANVGGN